MTTRISSRPAARNRAMFRSSTLVCAGVSPMGSSGLKAPIRDEYPAASSMAATFGAILAPFPGPVLDQLRHDAHRDLRSCLGADLQADRAVDPLQVIRPETLFGQRLADIHD